MTEKATKSLETLLAYKSLIRMVEEKEFMGKYLNEIRNSFLKDNISASHRIESISSLMQRFDTRTNMLFLLIDLPLLLDVHWLIQAERWKQKNKDLVYTWIENVSTLEALVSLAGSLHTHEDFKLPEISKSYQLKLKDAGHPLINHSERVCNDFEMHGQGSEAIITGSNMSGKSTFLRTLGINVVMALAGGPVSCKEARIPIMQVYTSMRTHDNLEEHISSFYAELKRIKGLLHLFEESKLPVFYLLDEILKGTNSVDRHLGAESLVVQLLPLNGMGLISTHDLGLSELEEKYDSVVNYSFNSTIEKDEIIFDYKIHNGICKGFNASKLMEKMGIVLHYNKN
jgi:DNA mismatch repair ATPase MutS